MTDFFGEKVEHLQMQIFTDIYIYGLKGLQPTSKNRTSEIRTMSKTEILVFQISACSFFGRSGLENLAQMVWSQLSEIGTKKIGFQTVFFLSEIGTKRFGFQTVFCFFLSEVGTFCPVWAYLGSHFRCSKTSQNQTVSQPNHYGLSEI